MIFIYSRLLVSILILLDWISLLNRIYSPDPCFNPYSNWFYLIYICRIDKWNIHKSRIISIIILIDMLLFLWAWVFNPFSIGFLYKMYTIFSFFYLSNYGLNISILVLLDNFQILKSKYFDQYFPNFYGIVSILFLLDISNKVPYFFIIILMV